jgi:hypothetical protein
MAAVAPRALLVADPVDGVCEPLEADAVREALRWPGQVFRLLDAQTLAWQASGAPAPGTAVPAQIAEWMRRHLHAEAVPGREADQSPYTRGHHEA